MSEAFIVASVRTPIGRFGGVLRDLSPVELGAHAMRAALERAGIDGADLDLYILGNVLRAGHGQLVPRQAAIKAGIPQEVDGYAIDMVCSGAMMAVINAANLIRLGDADLVLAGGVESMSQAGFYVSHRARWGYKSLLGSPEHLTDIMLADGLTDPITGESMGGDGTSGRRAPPPAGRAGRNRVPVSAPGRGGHPERMVQERDRAARGDHPHRNTGGGHGRGDPFRHDGESPGRAASGVSSRRRADRRQLESDVRRRGRAGVSQQSGGRAASSATRGAGPGRQLGRGGDVAIS